jgi:hypothetical protein
MVKIQTRDPQKPIECDNNFGPPVMCFHPLVLLIRVIFLSTNVEIFMEKPHSQEPKIARM